MTNFVVHVKYIKHLYEITCLKLRSSEHPSDVNTESLLKLTHIIWLYYGQVNNWKENGTRPNKIKKVQHRSRIIKTAARWNIFKTRNVLYLCNGLGQIVNRLEALRSTIQFSGVVRFTPLENIDPPQNR